MGYSPLGASPAWRYADLREDADGQDHHPGGRGLLLDRECEGEDPGQGGHPAGPAASDIRGQAARGRAHPCGLQHPEGVYTPPGASPAWRCQLVLGVSLPADATPIDLPIVLWMLD